MKLRKIAWLPFGLHSSLKVCFLLITMCPSLIWAQEIKMGVLAFRSKETTLTRWQSTAAYLSETIPGTIFKIIPMYFSEVEAAVQAKQVDFLLTNSGHYVSLEYRYGITRIVTLVRSAQGQLLNHFGGTLFTRADRNDINQLQDIRGKRFAAVNQDSLGGFLTAWEVFYEQNIDPFEDFSELHFTGMPHDNVVFRVQKGEADVGVVRSSILEQLAAEGQIQLSDFKILNQKTIPSFPFLYSTRLYPEWPLAKLSHTANDLAKKVAIALLQLTPTQEATKVGRYAGWSVPLDYQPLHEMMRKLQRPPYEKTDFTLQDVFQKYHWVIIIFGLILLTTMSIVFFIFRVNRTLQHQIQEREQAEQENQKMNRALQQEVEKHCSTQQELENAQAQLLQSEKMVTLGQLVAGIAHEINTPLGAIRSSIESISTFLKQHLLELPHFLMSLPASHQALFFDLLKMATQQQQSLTSREKRQLKKALLKQLETHALENATNIADTLVDLHVQVEEIVTILPLLQDERSQVILDTAYRVASLQRSTDTIAKASSHAAKVISALKSFVHYDHQNKKIPTDLTEGIEVALTLYHNQLKYGIEVIKDYRILPKVPCYPDELNQVWSNLIHNAVQAMADKGTLTITVTQKDTDAVVSITDSGPGIPEDVKPRIFEPFFTTKPVGEGSGLGLDITKKIVARHEGKIEIDSQPGKTTFSILLPLETTD
jgi:signal transduction histidine kinase